MKLLSILWVVFMFFELIEMGTPFLCFHCHQTSDECIDGDKLSLDLTNCSTNKCFVLKYETQMPGVTVLATFRGCLQIPEPEIMQYVKTEHHTVTKKHFHLCNYTMCNDADKSHSSGLGQLIFCFFCVIVSIFQH
nr:uncharacterized protein LOC111503017 [Leptinotarsa decemlineata]